MKSKIVSIVFLVIGLVFLLIGYYGYTNVLSIGEVESTTGKIINLREAKDEDDSSSIATISYKAHGTIYKGDISISSDTYKIGKEIKVYYSKEKPNIFYTTVELLFYIGFASLGGVFFIISIIVLVVSIINKRRMNYLLNNVTPFKAKVTNVSVDYSITVLNKHPYKLICTYEGKTYIKSGIFEDILTPFNEGILEYVDLYVDEKNEKRYYIDTKNINM